MVPPLFGKRPSLFPSFPVTWATSNLTHFRLDTKRGYIYQQGLQDFHHLLLARNVFDKLLFSNKILIKLKLTLVDCLDRLETLPLAQVQQEFQQLIELQLQFHLTLQQPALILTIPC